MAVTVVIFAWRKAGMTPSEFRNYYENTHVELVRSLAGPAFPLTHTRHYIERVPEETNGSDTSNAAYPPLAYLGASKDFDYDSYAELVWEDEATFDKFMGIMNSPTAAKELAADEQKFLSKRTIASIGETSVTRRS